MAQSDKLPPQARRFLATMAARGRRIIHTKDAYEFWSSENVARQALGRLTKSGWLQRVQRGLYLIVPLEAGTEGGWTEDPKIIASQLAPEGAVAYWSALHHWGMTEQIPRTIFVQTRRRKHNSRVTLLGVRYEFIFVVPRKLFGITKQWSRGSEFNITDREKTLIDALDKPDLSGGIPIIVGALRTADQLDWNALDTYLDRFASGAIYKRLGYLVESLDIRVPDAQNKLAAWLHNRSKGISLLDPGGPKEGRINTQWGIRINASGAGADS
ncbi:MAG: type IV toxin-antitoxin system AbiEi family antitoxin domain-containing protein [Anaerolineales bacterium]